jgi:ArsR family transcriptional regulator
MSTAEEMAMIFKALSDPNRLKILQILRECCPSGCNLSEADERSSVSRIAEQFDLSLSTVSHHLKELRIAGIIVCKKRGQTVLCALNEDVLRKLREFASS